MTSDDFKKLAKHYIYGLFASAWNGGIGAVAGILGIDGASMSGLSGEARVLNVHEMIAAFAGAFVLNGIFWLKSHPIPDTIETEPPFSQKSP